MKLAHKLILGAFLLASLIWGVGFYAITVSRRALQESIEDSSAILAAGLMDEVDRAIHTAIDDWLVYSAGPLVQRTVKASNQEFEKLQDVRAYIERQDREWRGVPAKTVTPFMKGLLANELSQALRTKLEAFERDEGYKAYGEVFVTNRYGANVAQTGKTTDYQQDDEEWWQRAKKDGVYVHDVQYDESAGVYSTDICVRVDDENGNFIGVIKAVFDIEGVFTILRSRISDSQFVAGHRTPPNLILIAADEKIIFPSDSSSVGLLGGSRFLKGHDHSHAGPVHTSHRYDEKLGEMLTCCAVSQGHDEFKSLGWTLVVEHKAEDILAPVAALRGNILMMSVAVTIVGLVLGIGFSVSLSRRISRLKNAAVRVGQGDLNGSLNIRGADEIGQLGRCFDQMTRRLSETLVAKSALEEANAALTSEMTERKRAEEHLRITLASIGDAVIAVDTDRHVVNLNGAAEQLTGWTLEEARGRPLEEVFHIINEETRKVAPDPVARVIASGQIEGLANHTVLIARDGTERAIADSAAPIQDASGKILGVVLVFRDITQERQCRKEKEHLLHAMGERVKELNCLYDLSRIVEKPGITLEGILQETAQLLPPSWRYPQIASGHIRFEGRVFETDACPQGPWCQSSDIKVNGRKAGSVEVCYREARPEADEGPFLNEERALIDAVAERLGRIIERKRTKEESQRHLQELERFNRLTVGREQRMIELKREVNETAHKAGLAPPYDLAFAESGKGGIGDEL